MREFEMGRKSRKELKRGEGKHERHHGEGTLQKRGKVWTARWTVDGETFTKTTGETNKDAAMLKLKEFVSAWREARSGRHGCGAADKAQVYKSLVAKVQSSEQEIAEWEDKRPSMTILQGWSAYRQSTDRPDSGPDTMTMYESQYNRMMDWMKANHADITELRGVTIQMAQEFARHLATNFSANTHNKYITLLKRVWNVLKDEARITVNPWERIRPRTAVMHSRRELTIDELRRVCASVDGEMRTLFCISIYTGMRLYDAVHLTWGATDLVRGFISIIPHKTARHAHGKPTIIPIPTALHNLLSEIPFEKRTGQITPQLASEYDTDSSYLSNKIQRIFTNCGIETHAAKASESERAKVDVGYHSLRHTYVSLCANSGASLTLIQSVVSHSNPAMTRHYLHASEEALKSTVACLPNVIEANAQIATVTTTEADARYSRFYELWSEMNAQERMRITKFIQAS